MERALLPAGDQSSMATRRTSPLFPTHILTSMMANVKLAVGTLKTTIIFTRLIFCVLILNYIKKKKIILMNILMSFSASWTDQGLSLEDLLDLALEKDYVRGKLADYLNKLIDLGLAGFRVDACKHMWPGDHTNIYGTKPFIYQEVFPYLFYPICKWLIKH